jgi:hypothetical protein
LICRPLCLGRLSILGPKKTLQTLSNAANTINSRHDPDKHYTSLGVPEYCEQQPISYPFTLFRVYRIKDPFDHRRRLTCLRPRQHGPFVSSSSSSLPLPVYTIFHDPIHAFPSLPAQTVSNEAANNPQNQHRNSPSIPTETPTISSMPTTPCLTGLERAHNEGK